MKFTIPDGLRSWHMSRLSSNSEVSSVVLHMRGFLSEAEIEAIRQLLVDGNCYRFRIGKARYYFGQTPQEAIDLAVQNHPAEETQ